MSCGRPRLLIQIKKALDPTIWIEDFVVLPPDTTLYRTGAFIIEISVPVHTILSDFPNLKKKGGPKAARLRSGGMRLEYRLLYSYPRSMKPVRI